MRIGVESYRHFLLPVISFPSVLPLNSQILPGHNQETYQRLQLALEATPPPQLWVAVCDDVPLQRQLAVTLEDRLHQQIERGGTTQLFFTVEAPNLVQQIQEWQQDITQKSPQLLQILGIEQLTHQRSDVQYQFLRSLRGLHPLWQQLGCSLLLWLPRPWLKQVQRSAPILCQTVFEFIGEPTPLLVADTELTKMPPPPIRQWQSWGQPAPEPPSIRQEVPNTLATPEATEVSASSVTQEDGTTAKAASTDLPTFSDSLWQRLQIDLQGMERPLQVDLDLQESESAPPSGFDTVIANSGKTTYPIGAVTVVNNAADSASTEVKPGVDEESGKPPITGSPWSEAQPSEMATTTARDPWTIAYELRDRVQAGDHSLAAVEATIQQYERLEAEAPATPHRTEALNDLGSLYWLWAQQAAETAIYQQRLARSCALYEAALSPLSPSTSADVLSRLHSNLGSVYSLIATYQNPMAYAGKAVKAFHRALQYTPVEAFPTEYATLQTHLGTAYWSLAQHSQEATHLHRAIAAYQEALRQASPQEMPQTYAQLQNNLGIALWSLARHERPVFLLEQAIAAYKSALAHRTLSTNPASCAATHNNLATAYWDLGGHYPEQSSEQKQAWQQAITAYETALMITTQTAAENVAFDVLATHHSVGVVYDQLAIALAPQTEAQSVLLNRAIAHYVKALIGWETEGETATETALQAIIRNLHLQARYLGVEAQRRSLNQMPATWLPQIWSKL